VFQAGGRPVNRSRALGDWFQPLHGCSLRRHRSEAFIAPQIAGGILQLERVDCVPLLLQPMRAPPIRTRLGRRKRGVQADAVSKGPDRGDLHARHKVGLVPSASHGMRLGKHPF
jgi:hypothetical protein